MYLTLKFCVLLSYAGKSLEMRDCHAQLNFDGKGLEMKDCLEWKDRIENMGVSLLTVISTVDTSYAYLLPFCVRTWRSSFVFNLAMLAKVLRWKTVLKWKTNWRHGGRNCQYRVPEIASGLSERWVPRSLRGLGRGSDILNQLRHDQCRCDREAKKERTPKVYALLPQEKATLLAEDFERSIIDVVSFSLSCVYEYVDLDLVEIVLINNQLWKVLIQSRYAERSLIIILSREN